MQNKNNPLSENFNLNNKNKFDENYQNFNESRLVERLKEKYRDKPFHEKWNKINKQVVWLSYILNGFSVFTGFTFLFFGMLFLMGISTSFKEIHSPTLLYLAILSGIISTVLLVLTESLKRGIAKRFFQEIIQYRKLSFALIGIVLFSGTSILFSYQGADRFVHEVRETPFLIDLDSIQDNFQIEIAKTDSLIQDNFKKNSWKGKLSRDARPTYNTLNKEKARLAILRDQSIKEAKTNNVMVLANFHANTHDVASYFALAQIFIEIILLLCLFWMEYYDFRSITAFSSYSKQQRKTLSEQEKQTIEPKHTIEHNQKHYTESQVNNFIRIYERRSSNPNSDSNTITNNEQTLTYWKGRKEEFQYLNGGEVLV